MHSQQSLARINCHRTVARRILRAAVSCLAFLNPVTMAQVPLQKVIGDPGEMRGISVAVSGDIAVFGAIGADNQQGAAYVYRNIGGTWVPEARLVPWEGNADQWFGFSVAAHDSPAGEVIVVGSVFFQPPELSFAQALWPGGAFVFRRTGGAWLPEQRLTASDAKSIDFFAFSVAVHGNVIVVGAPQDELPGAPDNGTGSCYVFEWNGAQWQQSAERTGSTVGPSGQFGVSVSVFDAPGLQRVVAGAYNDDLAGTPEGNQGTVYVYQKSGGVWTEEARLVAGDPDIQDDFGYSVALSGGVLAVGAIADDERATNAGAAYIFHAGDWNTSLKLTVQDGAAGDFFGGSVSLSGDLLAVGAPFQAGGIGAFYAWRWDGSSWLDLGKTASPDVPPATGEEFGLSAVDGGALVASARLDSEGGTDAGSVYFGSVPDTPAGGASPVTVQPMDAVTGSRDVTLTFAGVTSSGTTTVSETTTGPPPPSGFRLGNGNTYYEISTTAGFTGIITLRIAYDPADYGNPANLRLWHFPASGPATDITTFLDTVNHVVHGETTSLSPFAVLEAVNTDSDGDGLLDATEIEMAMGGSCPDPQNPDSDGDGLQDGAEVAQGTHPCSADTDADGVGDATDPLPTQPGVTSGWLEAACRQLAADIQALAAGLFTGPNANANAGRRGALANRAVDAANAVAANDVQGAQDSLDGLLEKIDGLGPAPDWLADGPAKSSLAATVLFLRSLLGL